MIQDTLNKRNSTHGNFKDNARIAQTLKSTLRLTDTWDYLPNDTCEALDMICHKIARIVAGNPDFTDHWHDIAGYATLIENRIIREEKMSDDNTETDKTA